MCIKRPTAIPSTQKNYTVKEGTKQAYFIVMKDTCLNVQGLSSALSMNFMYKNHFEVNARISMVFIFKVTPKLRTLLLANLSLIQNRFRNELQQFFFDCCQSQQILFTIADF